MSGGSAISHLEPACICASASRIAGISTALSFMSGMVCGACACAGRWPHGNGPDTCSDTVLAMVGLAPLPLVNTLYSAPLGSVFTPACERYCAM